MTKKSQGTITIAPEVLITIAKLNTLSIPGVSSLAINVGGMNRWFDKGLSEGVHIDVEDNKVYADIFVILKPDTNVVEASHAIQHQVARAISEMVGMEVGKVNIHIEDIELSHTAPAEAAA
jgi:uncharacterized alkaline shock family protein YloU